MMSFPLPFSGLIFPLPVDAGDCLDKCRYAVKQKLVYRVAKSIIFQIIIHRPVGVWYTFFHISEKSKRLW